MRNYAITSVVGNKLVVWSAMFGALLFAFPAHAQIKTNTTLDAASDSLYSLTTVVSYLTSIVIAFIFIFFFWNLAKFIKAEGDEKAEARTRMLWGVVGIAVFSTLWGAVAFLRNITGVQESNAVEDLVIPRVIPIPIDD